MSTRGNTAAAAGIPEKIEVLHLRIPFRFSFAHAAAARSLNDTILVRVQDGKGNTGWGEAIPRPYLTGETPESCIVDIIDHWWPLVRAMDFTSWENPAAPLAPLFQAAAAARKTAAWCAMDLAIWDLWARATGKPLAVAVRHTTAHGSSAAVSAPAMPVTMPVTMPVGLGSGRGHALMLRAMQAAGFRHFKLKVRGPACSERVRAARQILGPNVNIRLDANGALNLTSARELLDAVHGAGISALEQPLPPADTDAWWQLSAASPVPLVADESLCTPDDARQLLDMPGTIWNIRLAKNGGLTGTTQLITMARDAGIAFQVGALVGETSLLTAAGRMLLGAGKPVFYETSFPGILLRKDPFRGTAGGSGLTRVSLPNQNTRGLGATPVPAVIRALTATSRRAD